MLFALAWRNLWRQRTRTILSLASMALASGLLVFMLSMQLGGYESMKVNSLRILEGFAQVQSPAYHDDPDVSNYLPDADRLAERLDGIDGVTAAAPRGMSFVILAKGEVSYGAAVTGVDPRVEPEVSSLASTIDEGRYLQPEDSDAIIMGATLARNLGVSLGDRVTLLGAAADRSIAADSLEVVGIFGTGISALDRQIAQMPLQRFRETFAMPDGATMIAIGGETLADVNAALPAIDRAVAPDGARVYSWDQLLPALKQAIILDASTSSMIYVSMVVVVVFIILNTLMMSVLERTREFGVLLAIGMKAGMLGRLMWIELVLLSVLGCAIGIVLGGAVSYWFEVYGLFIPGAEGIMAEFGLPDRIYPDLSLISATAGPAAIIFFVALGGIVPYRRIRKLEPVAAMGDG